MPFELFVIGDRQGDQSDGESALFRFDGVRMNLILSQKPEGGPFQTVNEGYGGVVWIGPGEAYALPRFVNPPNCVIHYKRDPAGHEQLSDEMMPTNDAVTTLAYVDGQGMLAGTKGGQIYHRTATAWEVLGAPFLDRSSPIVRSILPYKTGFVTFS